MPEAVSVDVPKKRIVVVGTGYVGLPAALMWARAGHSVVGVDIRENIVKAINERTLLVDENELNSLLADPEVHKNLSARTSPCAGDVFVIAVPTPVDRLKKVADLTYVEAAVTSIAPHLRSGNVVLLESTVPPLTTRNVVAPLIEKLSGLSVPAQVQLAHCPERILPGAIFREIVENDRLIGGVDAASTDAAREVYASFVTGDLVATSDISAELAKLMENTFRDVNIAIANEFAHICEHIGVNVNEVIKLANRHPRVNILSPGIGVGGHCIPVDPWFLKEVAPYDSRLITAARTINDEMPERVAGKIRRAVSSFARPRIAVFGATYKKDCEDCRESPALEIVHMLKQDGYDVAHFDPLVPGMGYDDLGSVLGQCDVVVVLVAHTEMTRQLRDADQKGDRRVTFLYFDN
jgi:UDP-N-acetyl-D-mannosaminuronic acid dehydrogenase